MSTRGDLDRDLRALADTLDWPEAADLTAAVRARLDAREPVAWRGVSGLRPRSPLAVAAVGLLALMIAVALVPPARSAILRVLGFTSGARIVQAPPPPTVSHSPVGLGRPMSFSAAQRRVGFRIRRPAALGPPRRILMSRRIAGGAVTLRWPGTALTELQGDGTPYVEKLVQTGTHVRRVRVGTARAYWITGAPHYIVLRDRRGEVIEGTMALVRANVLLWDAGGIAYRLETRRSLAGALAVARSLR
jgi:hypothetical protein